MQPTRRSITQRSGKVVHAWAFEGDCDPAACTSITTSTEWPPRSGRRVVVPELDRVAFFGYGDARRAINSAQIELLDRLLGAI
jgi:predicted NUDIX family NTP pyrophosphohydrolase